MEKERLLNTKEVSKRLGVSPSTVSRLRRLGEISFQKFGHSHLVAESECARYAAKKSKSLQRASWLKRLWFAFARLFFGKRPDRPKDDLLQRAAKLIDRQQTQIWDRELVLFKLSEEDADWLSLNFSGASEECAGDYWHVTFAGEFAFNVLTDCLPFIFQQTEKAQAFVESWKVFGKDAAPQQEEKSVKRCKRCRKEAPAKDFVPSSEWCSICRKEYRIERALNLVEQSTKP